MNDYLGYLEIPLASGCNLKCKGCSHFSNADEHPFLLRKEEFGREIRRLAEIIPFIHTIRLLGGEPLLNPDAGAIVGMARSVYPASRICVVTNGLLIPSLDRKTLQSLAENRVLVQISLYPPVKDRMSEIAGVLEENSIRYAATEEITHFRKRVNARGDSDPAYEFEHCPVGKDCHYLDRGKLSVCPAPQIADIVRDRFLFDLTVREEDVLDIFAPDVTAEKVQSFLKKAPSVCRFCTEPELFEWSAGPDPKWEDWVVKA
ncbi:MAG: radical SAM protein [Lachnospiraceae bacterium]|nr:radical SAM protein [Lachnospiraceae bacterium]